METISFSFGWSEPLAAVLRKRAPASYSMSLVGEDRRFVLDVVNQGIDSHLEACFVPARGDKYEYEGGRLQCKVSAESLPVLVRRLLESPSDDAGRLAGDICGTLEIELV